MGYNNQNNNLMYVGSPYNFVPFSNKVWEYSDNEISPQNAVAEDLYSGVIDYHVTAKTPIMIDSGSGQFFKDDYGRYAIPGSSMRGLIRSNTQILSLSSISDDIDDYELMYRCVAGRRDDSNKDIYTNVLGADTVQMNNGNKNQSVSVLLNVRAGYVKNENGTYRIYDTAIDQIDKKLGMLNYYILSERKIQKDYFESKKSGREFSYDFFIKNGEFITQNNLKKEFKEYGQKPHMHYKGEKNRNYKGPYYLQCSYELSGRTVIAVGKAGKYSKEGYAVSTGYMNEKKAIYIIPAANFEKKIRFDNQSLPIEISKDEEKAFRIDLNKRSTLLKQHGGEKLFDLPDNGEVKPIFYIKIGERLYFGFTPRLRLFYENSIKQGLPTDHILSKCDYTKAIFGYSTDKDSRKTRVSFSNLVVKNDEIKKMKSVDAILAEPKPTSYMDYVEPFNDKGVTYNWNNFRLRGIKQYWLHSEAKTDVPEEKKGEKFVSNFTPLPENTEFEGKVRFHNLRSDELGLLLWAMNLNGGSYMNIGKAKAFGYGVICLEINDVKIIDKNMAYDLTKFSFDPYKIVDKNDFIENYKYKLKDYLGGKEPDEYEPIRTLLLMKNANHIPDPANIRYMSIDKKEYQNRLQPLQSVSEVLNVKINKNKRAMPSELTQDRGISRHNGSESLKKSVATQRVVEGISAVVRNIDDYGNVYLTPSDTIREHSRVPKENLGGHTYEVGDTILVKYIEKKEKKGKVAYIYRVI